MLPTYCLTAARLHSCCDERVPPLGKTPSYHLGRQEPRDAALGVGGVRCAQQKA